MDSLLTRRSRAALAQKDPDAGIKAAWLFAAISGKLSTLKRLATARPTWPTAF